MANPTSLKKTGHLFILISIIFYAAIFIIYYFIYGYFSLYFLGVVFLYGGFSPLVIAVILYISSAAAIQLQLHRKVRESAGPRVEKAKANKDLDALVIAVAKSHPKISMADLGGRLGQTKMQAEQRLLNLISKDKVRGHFDSVSGDFISAMVTTAGMSTNAQGFNCPHCGASLMSTPVKGMSMKCPSCGELVVVT